MAPRFWLGALLVLALCSSSASAFGDETTLLRAQSSPEDVFLEWASYFREEYIHARQEFAKRFDIFRENVNFIAQYNAQNGEMKLGLNEFADLTFEEFKRTRLGFNAEMIPQSRNTTFRYANALAPNSVDWRKHNVVTRVKNQGQCGSCWAFSTTGAIEGVNALATKELVELSEEQLVDCSAQNNGCGGGLMDYAFDYVVKNGGLDTEADYDYWGFTLYCNRRKEKDRTVVTIDGYEDVPENDEKALAQAAAHQPVAVAICVNAALQFYTSGVVKSCCEGLNHGVLLVGYDTDEDSMPYWLVKNSWGAGWGEEGFFRLQKDVGGKGMCGIAMMASYPVKNSPNPKNVPQMCDAFGFYECPSGTSCECTFSFFGLFCFMYTCSDGTAARFSPAQMVYGQVMPSAA